MARELKELFQEIHCPSSFRPVFVIIVFIVFVVADISVVKGTSDNVIPSDGSSSGWHHCPQGWTLFQAHCYKVTETALTWAQAQASCKSSGANLVQISSQCEQDWVSQFVTKQLLSLSQFENNEDKVSIVNTADESPLAAWIGFVRLQNKTFQWSDGHQGVEQDGFWAVDGLKVSYAGPSSLCCNIRAPSSNSKDLRWYLSSCEDHYASVCELQSCEEHETHCADGSQCVRNSWFCDGHPDCQDGSDERNCAKSFSSPLSTTNDKCGTVVKGASGILQSPGFPEGYPPFLNCIWKIETSLPSVIELLVHTLDIEETYDSLEIYEGSEVVDSNLLMSLDGSLTKQRIRSSGSFVTLKFSTDHSVQAKGFNISWTSVNEGGCGGKLVAADKETSLIFPKPEDDTHIWSASKKLSCDWVILSPDNGLLSLQFRNITLVEGDYITLYDGSGSEAPIISHINSSHGVVVSNFIEDFSRAAVASSIDIPPAVISSGPYLFIRVFITTGSIGSSSSFVLSYKNGCDVVISSSSSLILSPGYPNFLYPHNLNCSWSVTRDRSGRRLTLLFLPHFTTEAGKDYVQIYSSEREQENSFVGMESGPILHHKQGISSSRGFFIKFVSDATVNRGRWAAVVSYDCDDPSVLLPLIQNTSDTRLGAIVGFSCKKGYTVTGPSHAVCGLRGQWIPSNKPLCKEISCGPAPIPPNSYLTHVTGITYGRQSRYQCFYGFSMVGTDMSVCTDKGWEDVPSCEMITCPKERPPSGGKARAESIRVGTLREYFCKNNYHLIGSKFSHCNLSGNWTDQVPICEAPHCPTLHGILFGQLNMTEPILVGDSVRIICDEGYRLSGHPELTCLDNLQYDFPVPSCLDIDECDSPHTCGYHLCQNFPGGYNCLCTEGYHHPPNSTYECIDINECDVNNGGCSHECVDEPGGYTCSCPRNMSLYSGPWNQVGNITLEPDKTCIATCKPFVVGDGGDVVYKHKPLSSGELLYGTEAVVTCPPGLYPNGAAVVTCEIGTGWSSPVTRCTEKRCDTPLAIKNGHAEYSSQGLGSSVKYTCDSHYVMNGSRIRFCIEEKDESTGLANLVWSGTEPSCDAVTCAEPVPPINGTVDFSATTYDSVAVYRCQCGFELIGQSIVKCHSDGSWSHPSPTCEVQSCSHPGIPAHATMIDFETGFPVGSHVTYQCNQRGFNLTNPNPMKCLPFKQSKTSVAQPYLDLSIEGAFVFVNESSTDPACIYTYSVEELVKRWYGEAVHTCPSANSDIQLKMELTNNGSLLKVTVHLLITSDHTAATCLCGYEMLDYLKNLNHETYSNETALSWDANCPAIRMKDGLPLLATQHWKCYPGLRLEKEGQGCGTEALPTCKEDCVDEGIETHETTPSPSSPQYTVTAPNWVNVRDATNTSDSTENITSTYETSKPGRSVPSVESTPAQTSETSTTRSTPSYVITNKERDTTVGNTDSSVPSVDPNSFVPSTIASESTTTENVKTSVQTTVSTIDSTNDVSPSVDQVATTIEPLSTATSPSIVSTTRSLQISSPKPTLFDFTFSPPQPSLSPITSVQETTKPPNSTPLDFTHAGSDADFFGENKPTQEVWREGSSGLERVNSSNGRDSRGKSGVNCTAIRNRQRGNNNTGTDGWSESSSPFRQDENTTDCLTTHSLEKQEITMVQGPSVPSVDLSTPVYSVEVRDHMAGGFGNITCIDAVHININAKVNELLREFGNEMGKQVCLTTPDASLELTAGNIRFKGTTARIFIKFSIAYSVSTKERVEECAEEFKTYARSQLPKKFEKVQREVPVSKCSSLTYTKQDFNISFEGWTCRNGYSLDDNTFQCFHTLMEPGLMASAVSAFSMTSSPPAPVLTVPRLSMKFTGAFTSAVSPQSLGDSCVGEYTSALIKALSQIEPHIQSKFLCKDIYIDVTRNVVITFTERRIIAEATVHLVPLREEVDFQSMSKCAKFISIDFREPSQQLPSVTLTKDYLSSCPEITLSPHGLRSDINDIHFYCPLGYVFSDANFKCIDENLPLYASGIELLVSGTFEGIACESVVRDTALKLVEDVIKNIQLSLSQGRVCNKTRDIVILQLQGDLFVQHSGVTVSIPITLVSLLGSQADCTECAKQLYRHLSTALSQPVSSMVATLENKCGASITMPGDYTVAYTEWECFPQHTYNALTHQCQSIATPAPETQTIGLSLSTRHKRAVSDVLLKPQWTATLPECLDLEPPVFSSCPDSPVIIPSGHLGPFRNITLPSVSDSSGKAPKVTILPSDFRIPYKFTKNTTIQMEAEDSAGNKATCLIHVVVEDQILPTINCPTNLVTIFDDSGNEYTSISYANAGVTARDNSGQCTIHYNPPQGSKVRATDVVQVTAFAEDDSHNTANCSFFAAIEPLGCPDWSLPSPVGGNKTCTTAAPHNKGLSCAVSCPKGKWFAVQPPEQYVCLDQWQPHNRVPECVDGMFPDYELHLSFYLSYKGNTTEDCLGEAVKAVVEAVRPRQESACENASEQLNVTYIHVGHVATPDQSSRISRLTAKIKILVQSIDTASVTTTAQWCGYATLRALTQAPFNETLDSPCWQIKLTGPSTAGTNSCPEGFTLVSGMCYQCPSGSYWFQPQCIDCPTESLSNVSGVPSCFMGFDCPPKMYRGEPQCIECPHGTYQNVSGSLECVPCDHGFSTPSIGAKTVDECRALCDVNHFSYNGLEPCIPCPVGSHQPSMGSTQCEACEIGDKDRSRYPYCKKLCAPGEYSPSGIQPCTPCPQNFYSHEEGSTTCIECPDSLVTTGKGSVNRNQCQERDPCQVNPCKHKGVCHPYGRDFECECTQQYKGETCQEQVDVCDGQYCRNNGRCRRLGHTARCECASGFTGPTCATSLLTSDHCSAHPCVHGTCMNVPTGFMCFCFDGYEGRRCDINTNDCANITCQNSGFCVDLVNGFRCSCVEGFTGTFCERSVDDCPTNSCLNGGKCVDGYKTFTCSCPQGFTGEWCEVNIDDCSPNQCLNGGICQDGVDTFNCLCKPEYSGNLCQTRINPCQPSPCLNGGVCTKDQSILSGFNCQCPQGFTGKICEQNIDDCSPMPCNTQGTMKCEDLVDDFRCICLPGWTGSQCEEQMDPCSSHPCGNSGTCHRNGLTFSCQCPNLFTGPSCATFISPCHSNPCQNLAVCKEKDSSFICECRPGFSGHLCDVNIDECETQPCLNGECQDGVNAFTCDCEEGFAGELCEVDIDECLSQPCQHNSTCRDLAGDFRCDCKPGFTGKFCDTEVDECESAPCHNEGKCVDKIGSFDCICPEGYAGHLCEDVMDKCEEETLCLNGGTCHKVKNKDVCQCLPHYAGPDCGKAKSTNFDLVFTGDSRSGSFPPVMHVSNMSELSLCLWVRFSQPRTDRTFLVLTWADSQQTFLRQSGTSASSFMFPSKVVSLLTNNGFWHHVCWILDALEWMVYIDGEVFLHGATAEWIPGNLLKLRLGVSAGDEDDAGGFKGQLHGVNIFSYVLSGEEISNMSQHCNREMVGGDLFDWVEADSYLYGNVVINMPSLCEHNLCSDGSGGSLCSLVTATDKTPPEVIECPDTIVVTSEKMSIPVTWPEPEFSDDVGIVLVKQNYRSGQIFGHGQYLITYTAYDAQNNSADCSFPVFVRKFDCVDPAPPANGARVCGEWEHGRYCIPTCTTYYRFVTPVPPFYRCGYEGVWDPPNGDPFAFPACARTHPPAHTIFGGINFEGPECTASFKQKLQEKLVRILTQLDNIIGLCETDHVCDYTQGLDVQCGEEDLGRTKRAVTNGMSVYTVAMNVSISRGLTMEESSVDSISEEFVTAVKHDLGGEEFTLTAVDIHLTPHCDSGQALEKTDNPQCLDCPVGHYVMNEWTCSPCPKGFYNDMPLSTFCVPCYDGLTTSKEGATSASQCLPACQSGKFFNVNTSKCEECPVGLYQSSTGQQSCQPCPLGLTTLYPGAKSVAECKDTCGVGEELGEDRHCRPCPLGTYNRGSDVFCTPCPYGWTTAQEGSVEESQCSLEECTKGHYQDLKGKTCHPCPLGTFQQSRGAVKCEPCGVGLTTQHEGADSRSLCIQGEVDECELGIDSCGPNMECLDLQDGYSCECKYGRTSDGQCIDLCERYCDQQRRCEKSDDGDDSIKEMECDCGWMECRNTDSRDRLYQSLVISCISVAVIATLILLVIVGFWIVRKNQQIKQVKRVRFYRDDNRLEGFTNEAFDSLPAQLDLDSEGSSPRLPTKLATRWHSRSFMATIPPSFSSDEDDIESTDL